MIAVVQGTHGGVEQHHKQLLSTESRKKYALIPEKRDESENLHFVWSPGGGPEQGSGGAAPAEASSLGLVRPKQFPAKHREKRGLGNETMLL